MEETNRSESNVAKVHRQLGRCLIRLQQYEKLLKALIAESNISATLSTLPEVKEARANAVSRQTLGQLFGIATETIFRKAGDAEANCNETGPDMPLKEAWLSMKWSVELDRVRYEDLLLRFRRLVDARNMLVHHLLDEHDLATNEGCASALELLNESYALIDREMAQLQQMARTSTNARHMLASFVSQHPEVLAGQLQIELLEGHPLVRSLQHAEQALAQDGWTRLEDAFAFLRKHHPDETPKRYGFGSWRHVLHESPVFTTRKERKLNREIALLWYQTTEPTKV